MVDTDQDAVREAAEALNRGAITSNDADAIGRLLADDWVLVDGGGVGPRQRFLTLVESGELTHSSMAAVQGTERVVVYGDIAIWTARVTNTAHFGGQRFDADEWVTDVFARSVDGWFCLHAQATPAVG